MDWVNDTCCASMASLRPIRPCGLRFFFFAAPLGGWADGGEMDGERERVVVRLVPRLPGLMMLRQLTRMIILSDPN